MKIAAYYTKMIDNDVVCDLCPHHCRIKPDKTGICRVRKNIGGNLYTLNYGLVSSAALDPIEKKPLFNFHPGSYIFSIGSVGCNLGCLFCQNWNIATADEQAIKFSEKNVDPALIIETALKVVSKGNIGIAYTYKIGRASCGVRV